MHNLYQQHVAPTWENSFTDFRLFYCLQSVLERASGFRGNSAELSANTDLGEGPKFPPHLFDQDTKYLETKVSYSFIDFVKSALRYYEHFCVILIAY